jgi:MYXO-CTERM domain-containing protein
MERLTLASTGWRRRLWLWVRMSSCLHLGRGAASLLGAAAFCLATLAFTPTARAERTLYYGGRVISNVEVVEVFWTSAVDPMIQSQIGPFFTAITASPYLDWLEEYDTIGLMGQDLAPGSNQHIGRGTFSMAVTITPKNTATSLLDSDVQTELVGQINAGVLPAPTLDAGGNVNTLYMVEFPTGYVVTVEGLESCGNFCGYHFTIPYTGPSGTSPAISVPYAVMPDISGCGGSCSSGWDEVTSIHTHELMEAITDTEAGLLVGMTLARPLAWYDPTDNMELADICDPFVSAPGVTGGNGTIAGYTVQLIWSNFANACVAEIPLCDGTTSEPACRPCTQYDNGVDCTGATPVCQTSSTATNAGQCVGCIDNTACAVPTPICDLPTTTCRACTSADCTGTTPLCGASGACVQCDATNSTACTGATPVCDLTTGTCVGCQTNTDCSGHTPICNLTSNTCQACKSNSDCTDSSGKVCDTGSDSEAGECVDCNTNKDCPAGTCNPKTHTCLVPKPDAGAPSGDAGKSGTPTPTSGTSGCSCTTATTQRPANWALTLVLAGLGVALRRRSTGRR